MYFSENRARRNQQRHQLGRREKKRSSRKKKRNKTVLTTVFFWIEEARGEKKRTMRTTRAEEKGNQVRGTTFITPTNREMSFTHRHTHKKKAFYLQRRCKDQGQQQQHTKKQEATLSFLRSIGNRAVFFSSLKKTARLFD